MATMIRCNGCGTRVSIELGEDREVICPHCHNTVDVPSALRALPRPITGREPVLAIAVAGGGPTGFEVLHNRVAERIARFMPWAFSFFLHAAVILLIALVVVPKIPPEAVVPETLLPIPPMLPEMGVNINLPPQPEVGTGKVRREGGSMAALAPKHVASVIGPGPGSGLPVGARMGVGWGTGEGMGFGDGKGNDIFERPRGGGKLVPQQVVYVIDRSGSMVPDGTFDAVRYGMAWSIGHLCKGSSFHVILFGNGTTIENPPRALVPANQQQQEAVGRFLKNVTASGQTDPLPAIRRAFDVLKGGVSDQPRVIHLLTDGAFQDSDKVVSAIRNLNASGGVRINTYLYGGSDEMARNVLKQIAKENGGVYSEVQNQ